MEILVGALAAALVTALAGLVTQHLNCRRLTATAVEEKTQALDRAHAAELRSAQQIDAMLDRISTSPRIEVRPAHQVTTDPAEKHYISDEPYMDETWNDFRTGGVEEPTE